MSEAQKAGPDLHAIFGMDGEGEADSSVISVGRGTAEDMDSDGDREGKQLAELEADLGLDELDGDGPSVELGDGEELPGVADGLDFDLDESEDDGAVQQEQEADLGVTRPSRPGLLTALPDGRDRRNGPGLARAGREALESSRGRAPRPSGCCSNSGAITQDGLARALAERYGLDHLDLGVFRWTWRAANLVSTRVAKRYQAVPVGVRRQAHAAGGDGRPVQRAGGRRHRDHDRLRGPRRGRAAGGHRRPDLAAGPAGRRRRRAAEAVEEEGGARRGRRPARDLRRRAGRQARQPDRRAGGRAGRLRHPPRARRERAAGPLPRRRRPAGRHHRPAADGRRRDLAHQDHGRAEHRRAAPAPGRPRRADGRRPPHRPARRDAAERPRRGRRDARPGQGVGGRRASTSSAWPTPSASASSAPAARRTARCS